jgi:benzoyl-CoA reductase/2-hydroxyglutaryl-CoA dehydratase subunit BcrC/BadD/HgdB
MGTEDAMNTMVPGNFLLGTQEALDFYQDLYKELKALIVKGVGLVPEEKYRILWGGGLPPWFALGEIEYLKKYGATFPVEYTYRPYVESWDPSVEVPRVSDPLEYLAWRWVKVLTGKYDKARKRPGSHPVIERLIEYIEGFDIDGVIMHQCYSCRSWHVGLKWRLNTLKKVYGNIPSVILESDMVDASSYSAPEAHMKLDAFMATVEASKNR